MLPIVKHLVKKALGITGEKYMLKVGDAAPDFRVRDHTGRERTLQDWAGKSVVLWFYPKANTSG